MKIDDCNTENLHYTKNYRNLRRVQITFTERSRRHDQSVGGEKMSNITVPKFVSKSIRPSHKQTINRWKLESPGESGFETRKRNTNIPKYKHRQAMLNANSKT